MFSFFSSKTVPSSPPAINSSSPLTIKPFKYHTGANNSLYPKLSQIKHLLKSGGPGTLNQERLDILNNLPDDNSVILKYGTPGRITIQKHSVPDEESRVRIRAGIDDLFEVIEIIEHPASVSYIVTLRKDTQAIVYENALVPGYPDQSFIRFSIGGLTEIISKPDGPVTFNVMYPNLFAHFPRISGGKHGRKTRHRKRKSQRKSRRRHH